MNLAVLRRLIASPVTLEGMELAAATAAHAPGSVLRADTLRQVQQRDPERKTALPVLQADMELKAVRPVHVQETVLRADTRHWRISLDQLQMTARPVEWAST